MTAQPKTQTPHKPTLSQRVAILGAIVGATSDEIDAAIVELRKERRKRQVSQRAQRRWLIQVEQAKARRAQRQAKREAVQR